LDNLLFKHVQEKGFEAALGVALQKEHLNTISNNDQNISLQSYQNIGISKICLGNFHSALTEFKVAVDTATDVFQCASFKVELGSAHLLVKNAFEAMQSLHSVLDSVGLGYVVDKFGLVTDLGIQSFTEKRNENNSNTGDEVSDAESKARKLDYESAQQSSRASGYAILDTGALITRDSDDDSYQQKVGKYEKILTAAELVARSLNNIACVYVEVGKLEAAYVTLEEAKELILQMIQKMKRKCKKYPEVSLRSIKTALTVCAMNIGYLQLRRANFVEAVNVFEEANYLVEENFGKEHESLAYILSQLSYAYLKVSFYDESVKVLQRLLTFQIASKTSTHSPTYITLVKLALICVKMDNFYVGLGYLEEALQLFEQQQGQFYPVKNPIFSREKMEEFLWKLKHRIDPKTDPNELIVSWNSNRFKHLRESSQQLLQGDFEHGSVGDLENFVDSNLNVPLAEFIQDVTCVGPIAGDFIVLRNVVMMELVHKDEIEEDGESELEVYDYEHKEEVNDDCRPYDLSQCDFIVEILLINDKNKEQAYDFALKVGKQINVVVSDKFYLLELIHSNEENEFYDDLIDYVDNEEYEEAAQLYKKEIESLPKNSPSIPKINQILSLLYFYMQQYKLSLSYIESSIGAENGNPQTREYCQFHQHAAITNLALGRYVEALEHFHEVLRVQRICLGESHISTSKTHQAIASTHFELEEYRAALLHIQACVAREIANEHDTSKNRHYAYLKCWMGVAQCRLGDYMNALPALNEALAIQRTTQNSSDTHASILFTMDIIASTNVQLGNHNDALQMYTDMLRMLKGDFLNNHAQCELIVQKMNYVYISKGQYQEAINNLKILQKFQLRNSFDESTMYRPLMDRTKSGIAILERKKSEAIWI